MNSFNVLNRDVNVHRSYLLEASAGTGKTFAIENIVTRLLIEENFSACKTLEQILVVTFTRAARRDLKIRIRSALENALQVMNGSGYNAPDYLIALLEMGQEKKELAKRRLEEALAIFDQAQIYTLHSFCLRMLHTFVFESDFHRSVGLEERTITVEELQLLIRDFFRTKMHPDKYSAAQLQIILKQDKSIEKVQKKLMDLIEKDYIISPSPSFSSDLKDFNTVMRSLITAHDFTAEKLQEDFEKQSDCYRVLKNNKISCIPDFFVLFKKNEWNSEDLDFLIKNGLPIYEFLDPANAKKNKKFPDPSSLNYPHLMDILQKSLVPLLTRAGSYEFIFARMAHDCGQFVQKYLDEEEKHSQNDILKQMLKALDNPIFNSSVKALFHAAIIDEFQDTDPSQWEIFQRLFLGKNSSCLIYLVGDPKQSIYAFRQADIYTYLSAAASLGSENHASLDTNYRSQPSLVQGLNALFQACPQIFTLPALGSEQALEYSRVKAAPHASDKLFKDSLGSIHFFYAADAFHGKSTFPSEACEKEFYFPFMAQEILRLHDLNQLKFSQFAVLVKDRYQARSLGDFLGQYQIPYALQKQSSLTDSLAWSNLKELLLGVLQPNHVNSVKIALGGQILQWNHHDIKRLDDATLYEMIVAKFYTLKRKLHESFASFFSYLMQSCWHANESTVTERILGQEEGDLFLDELNQIAQLLIVHQSEHPSPPEYLIDFMDSCKKLPLEDEDRLKKYNDPNLDAVSILTIHNSKGLEFDVVFALGLVNRSKSPSLLIPQKKGREQHLVPCLQEDSDLYMQHCEEVDAEKMRQLYVAMTRAKYRLYVPALIDTKGKIPSFGQASPMEIFLARLGRPPCHYRELYQRMGQTREAELLQFMAEQPEANLSYTSLNESTFSLSKIKNDKTVILSPPEVVHIPGEQLFIHSFTSLSKQKKSSTAETLAIYPPHDFDCPHKNAHQLPAGTLTGKLLHKILEVIPFSSARNITSAVELAPIIQPLIEDTAFKKWHEVLCDMAFQALKAPLSDGFCLAHLNPTQMYRETEFLYPYEKDIQVEGMLWHAGFLKGVIDLVFCHEGLYYLIDWKSNWLGTGSESYCSEKMKFAMQQHDYFFQAHIYKEALKRYLRLVDPRPFEEIYGGCFYIFLRGLNLSANETWGIFKV